MPLGSAIAAALLLAASPTGGPQAVSVPCDSAAPACGWTIAWQNEGTRFAAPVADGHAVLRIANAGDGVGFVEREIAVAGAGSLRVIRYEARIKVDAASGRGAGLNLAVLAAGGTPISHHTMGYADFGMAAGTRDWQPAEIAVVLPADATAVKIGLILYGPGAAAFDDVRAEVRGVDDVPPSAFARGYVDEAIAIVREHALARAEVDLDALADEARRIAGDAKTASEAYPAIRYVLDRLGDHHSFFMSREEKLAWQGGDGGDLPAAAMPSARNLDGIGYVAVPGFHSDAGPRKRAFAQAIQDHLRALSEAGVRGWVVDLRANDGGNMFPMLAGLAPLFDAEVLGYLVDVEGGREPWGVAAAGDEGYVAVSRPADLPRRLPIAVLFGPRTGSSGEIVLLSFVGNAMTRSFGEPSYGLTTGNGIFPLSDGSELRLASTRMADRSGRVHEGRVPPDVTVAAEEGKDTQLDAALAWLRSQDADRD